MLSPFYLVIVDYKHYIGEVEYVLYNAIEYVTLDLLKAQNYVDSININDKRLNMYTINAKYIIKAFMDTPYLIKNLLDSEIISK